MYVCAQAEGLVHVSNISSARLGSAKEAVERGQEVWVKVVSVRCVFQASPSSCMPASLDPSACSCSSCCGYAW